MSQKHKLHTSATQDENAGKGGSYVWDPATRTRRLVARTQPAEGAAAKRLQRAPAPEDKAATAPAPAQSESGAA